MLQWPWGGHSMAAGWPTVFKLWGSLCTMALIFFVHKQIQFVRCFHGERTHAVHCADFQILKTQDKLDTSVHPPLQQFMAATHCANDWSQRDRKM